MYAPWVGVPLADAAGRVMTIGWPNGIGLNQPTNRPFAAVLDFSRDDTVRTDCLVNGASFEDLRVTPDSWTRVAYGEIITIFGRGLGPAVGLVGKLDATGTLPVELGGTSLSMSGVALPLLYVSDGQVNAIVPFQIPGGSAGSKTIRLTAGGVNLEVGVEVSRSPAFFFLGSTNFAAAIGEDGRVITRANPARPGEIVALFGTGFGLFSQNVPDGKVISLAPPWPTLEQFADLRYGDPPVKRLEILYAGPAPGLIAGVVQINARIPADAAGPLTIRTPDGSPIELPIQ